MPNVNAFELNVDRGEAPQYGGDGVVSMARVGKPGGAGSVIEDNGVGISNVGDISLQDASARLRNTFDAVRNQPSIRNNQAGATAATAITTRDGVAWRGAGDAPIVAIGENGRVIVLNQFHTAGVEVITNSLSPGRSGWNDNMEAGSTSWQQLERQLGTRHIRIATMSDGVSRSHTPEQVARDIEGLIRSNRIRFDDPNWPGKLLNAASDRRSYANYKPDDRVVVSAIRPTSAQDHAMLGAFDGIGRGGEDSARVARQAVDASQRTFAGGAPMASSKRNDRQRQSPDHGPERARQGAPSATNAIGRQVFTEAELRNTTIGMDQAGHPAVLIKVGSRDNSIDRWQALDRAGISADRVKSNSNEYYIRVSTDDWNHRVIGTSGSRGAPPSREDERTGTTDTARESIAERMHRHGVTLRPDQIQISNGTVSMPLPSDLSRTNVTDALGVRTSQMDRQISPHAGGHIVSFPVNELPRSLRPGGSGSFLGRIFGGKKSAVGLLVGGATAGVVAASGGANASEVTQATLEGTGTGAAEFAKGDVRGGLKEAGSTVAGMASTAAAVYAVPVVGQVMLTATPLVVGYQFASVADQYSREIKQANAREHLSSDPRTLLVSNLTNIAQQSSSTNNVLKNNAAGFEANLGNFRMEKHSWLAQSETTFLQALSRQLNDKGAVGKTTREAYADFLRQNNVDVNDPVAVRNFAGKLDAMASDIKKSPSGSAPSPANDSPAAPGEQPPASAPPAAEQIATNDLTPKARANSRPPQRSADNAPNSEPTTLTIVPSAKVASAVPQTKKPAGPQVTG